MKKIFTSILVLILLALPTQAFASFEDVTEDFDYYYAIEYLEDTGAISSNTNFNPDESITRAAFFKMLLANAGIDIEDVDTNYFDDLTGDEWYAPYANKAVEIGLIDVNPSNPNFNGQKSVTRAEATKLLLKWGGIATPMYITEEDWTLSYRDVANNHMYAPYIQKSLELDIMPAYNEHYFGTYRKLSRSDAALAIYNLDSYTLTDAYIQAVADEIRAGFDVPLILMLEDIYSRIMGEYYGEDVDGEELMYETIKGMVEAVGDSYTVFMEPSESETFYDNLSGDFKGIGIYVEQEDDGTIVITEVIEGTPAEEAGLEDNDTILAVDDVDVEGMTLEEVIAMIKGEEGTEVELTIWRSSAMESRKLRVTVERAEITIPYITAEILEDNILYYDLLSFGETTGTEFVELTQSAMDDGDFEGILLDMRNNGGGYIYTAIQILSQFVPENETLFVISYTDLNTIYISEGPGTLSEYPIVVLINENSASASEIVASALQEYGYGEIMGTVSFGKGSAQDVYDYYEGSTLKITTSHWLTPNWIDLDQIGVTPDISVEDDNETSADEQLDAAIEKLQEMME